jgi:mono/diheme cytochrome c family protein
VLFLKNCTGCHGPTGAGVLGPSLANATFQNNASRDLVFRTVAFGRSDTAMPGFLAPDRGGLDRTDIDDLVAYVKSLGMPSAGATASTSAEPVPESPDRVSLDPR